MTALDHAEPGLAQIVDKAAAVGLTGSIRTVVADARGPLSSPHRVSTRATPTCSTRAGADHGDDGFEMGGFVVHYFDRPLIDRLAAGFELVDVAEFEEGKLPRRLFAITMRKG